MSLKKTLHRHSNVRDCTQITVLIRTKTRRAIYSLFLFSKIVFCLLQIHSFVLALLNSAGTLHVQCIYILPSNLFFKELKGYVMHWCTWKHFEELYHHIELYHKLLQSRQVGVILENRKVEKQKAPPLKFLESRVPGLWGGRFSEVKLFLWFVQFLHSSWKYAFQETLSCPSNPCLACKVK